MANVLYIENGLGKGGSALSLKYLIDALDKSRYKPFLLFTGKGASTNTFSYEGAEILVEEERKRNSSRILDILFAHIPDAFSLSKLIREKKINLVHLNNDIDSHYAGILACRLSRTPFICHLRCTRPLTKLEKLISKWVSHFIVLTESNRDFYIKQGIPAEKITVSYDPFLVEMPKAQSVQPEWLSRVNGYKKVAICSRLSKGKGHETFLNAAALVLKEEPKTHFFVMGDEGSEFDSGYRKKLETLVEELKIENSVTFTGWQNNILSALSLMDVVVDASILPEGVRRTMIEAMIAGKPVVATNVGPTKEIFEKSGGGLLLEVDGEAGVLAEKLVGLLKDSLLRKTMGEKGQGFAVKMFDMREKAKEIEALYAEVLKPSSSVPGTLSGAWHLSTGALPREFVPCDICGENTPCFIGEAKSLYSDEKFNLVRCRQCSLVYVNPRQEESAKFEQIEGIETAHVFEEAQERDKKVYQWVLTELERYSKKGKLLDVGSATGGLIREAQQRGWQVQGVEINKAAAEFSAKTYGLNVHAGTFESANFPNHTFDAVIMVHVIEHIYHPSKLVAEVFRVLKPGGHFYCITPDFNHTLTKLAQVFGFMKGAEKIDPTGHPYQFEPRSLSRLVEKQGFKVRYSGSPIAGLFASRSGVRGWKSLLIKLMAIPVIALSRIFPMGSTVHCIAQKPESRDGRN